jgi:hypothetical protein
LAEGRQSGAALPVIGIPACMKASNHDRLVVSYHKEDRIRESAQKRTANGSEDNWELMWILTDSLNGLIN